MSRVKYSIILGVVVWVVLWCWSHVCAFEPFTGEITQNQIYVRSDSTVSAESLCQLNEGDIVEVVFQKYDWYKIRLPDQASVYIAKEYISVSESGEAYVNADKVNIRASTGFEGVILGTVGKDTRVSVLDASDQWYRIKAVPDAYAWVHKKFVRLKKEEPPPPAPVVEEIVVVVPETPFVPDDTMVVEGVLKPKIITTVASYKLITKDKRVFLLQGEEALLVPHKYNRVSIRGVPVPSDETTDILLQVKSIEALP